jgi:hypothetical protein
MPREHPAPSWVSYNPESYWIEFPPEPGFYGCPTVDSWCDAVTLQQGDETLTDANSVTIVFGYGLPDVELYSPNGFTKRQSVDRICQAFQKAHFVHDHNFLEEMVV